MRLPLFHAALAILSCAAFGQDLGSAMASAGRQAAGIIGNLGGTAARSGAVEEVEKPAPAAKKSRSAKKAPASNLPPITPVTRLAIQPAPKPVSPYVSEQAIGDVKDGTARQDLIAAFGNPQSVSRIQGLAEGNREVFTYRLSPTRSAYVRLLNGVVVGVSTD